MRGAVQRAVLFCASLLALAAPAGLAQAPAAPPASTPTVEAGGLPVRDAPPRTLRAQAHVYIAFAIAWILLFGYALSLGRRFARLEREVDQLHGGPREG